MKVGELKKKNNGYSDELCLYENIIVTECANGLPSSHCRTAYLAF